MQARPPSEFAWTVDSAVAKATLTRALAHLQTGHFGDAETEFRRLLQCAPEPAQFAGFNLIGAYQMSQGRFADAAVFIQRAYEINPRSEITLYNLGVVHQNLGHDQQALKMFDAALSINAGVAETWNNRGVVLGRLMFRAEAAASFRHAVAIKPGYAEAHYNLANALSEMGDTGAAVESYRRALALRPDFAEALDNLGAALLKLHRYDEAYRAFDRALTVRPDLPDAEGARLHAKMHACDWTDLDGAIETLHRHIREGRRASAPFPLLVTGASAALQLQCAQRFAADRYPASAEPLWRGERYRHDRIRIGYVSGEFREQATAYLTADLFECHDKSRFETFGISTGGSEPSPMRARLAAAFDHFIDGAIPDAALAALIRRHEIDILVNLNGYFGVERTGTFALRPAPVQVNYLGFPGTMGAPYIDYIVADRIVIPEDMQHHYSEKIVYLPDSYQPNDRRRAMAAITPSRADLKLPEHGFVFCCFNNTYKLNPATFTVWMRLLLAVDGSVLWLLEANAAAAANLRREAELRGVSGDRIVFAPFVPLSDHLARCPLADLFLDTLPCNAHTTASDALWVGVPLLTCLGDTFAGRVAASLLQAAGVPELITRTLDEYEARALEFASEPARLAPFATRLVANRERLALFDTRRYTRQLEAAYVAIWERTQRAEPPATVAAMPVP